MQLFASLGVGPAETLLAKVRFCLKQYCLFNPNNLIDLVGKTSLIQF